jgi:hypothetical protein
MPLSSNQPSRPQIGATNCHMPIFDYCLFRNRIVSAETLATRADACGNAVGSVTRTVPGGQGWSGVTCDDFWLAGLKLIFLIVTRGAGAVAAGGVVEGCRDPDAAPSA